MKQRVKQLLAFRRLLLLLSYTAGLSASLWLAYELRFDFIVPSDYDMQFVLALCWIIPLKLLFLLAFKQFSGKLTVFSTPDFGRLFSAMWMSSVSLLLLRLVDDLDLVPPRSLITVDFVLSVMALGGLRLGLRTAWERLREPALKVRETTRRIGIIGAGDVGANLVRELLTKRHVGLEPVAIFDDDRHSWRSRVHGIPVLGAPELLLELGTAPTTEDCSVASSILRYIGARIRFTSCSEDEHSSG